MWDRCCQRLPALSKADARLKPGAGPDREASVAPSNEARSHQPREGETSSMQIGMVNMLAICSRGLRPGDQFEINLSAVRVMPPSPSEL